MCTPPVFKWCHFQAEILLLNVRWYCRYALSYRDLEEIMQERGVEVDHSTINRWVLKYAPELEKRIRPHLRGTNDSWRVDETYIKVKGRWKYLYGTDRKLRITYTKTANIVSFNILDFSFYQYFFVKKYLIYYVYFII